MSGCAGSADGSAPQRGARFPAEAQALGELPDSDILYALRELPYDLRLAVYLADVEGYRYNEIAEIMGTPVGTVVSCLHNGRGKLRDKLALFAMARGLAVAPS
jgi:RNA polymerase sigma-70 factor, ECF subfamily